MLLLWKVTANGFELSGVLIRYSSSALSAGERVGVSVRLGVCMHAYMKIAGTFMHVCVSLWDRVGHGV